MNGYIYLDSKYARPLISFLVSSGTETTIDGIYDKLSELYNTKKVIFISVDNVTIEGTTTDFRNYLSIYKVDRTFAISTFPNVSAFVSDTNTVNKVNKVGG